MRKRRNTNEVTKEEMKGLQTLLQKAVAASNPKDKGYEEENEALVQAAELMNLLEIPITPFITPKSPYEVKGLIKVVERNLRWALSGSFLRGWYAIQKKWEKLIPEMIKIQGKSLKKEIPWFDFEKFLTAKRTSGKYKDGYTDLVVAHITANIDNLLEPDEPGNEYAEEAFNRLGMGRNYKWARFLDPKQPFSIYLDPEEEEGEL